MVAEPMSSRPEGLAPASRIWWWVVIAFVVQIAVWSAWFVVAKNHPVAEVPLAREERR